MHETEQSPYNYVVDQGKLNWIIDGYHNIVFLGRFSKIISCGQYLCSCKQLFQNALKLQFRPTGGYKQIEKIKIQLS